MIYSCLTAFQVLRHLISGQLPLECNLEHSPFSSEIPSHRASVCFLWLGRTLWKKLFCRLTDRVGHGVLRNGASPRGPLPGICPKSMKLSRICSRQMWIIYAPPFHSGVCLHEKERRQDLKRGPRWWQSCELLERPGPGVYWKSLSWVNPPPPPRPNQERNSHVAMSAGTHFPRIITSRFLGDHKNTYDGKRKSSQIQQLVNQACPRTSPESRGDTACPWRVFMSFRCHVFLTWGRNYRGSLSQPRIIEGSKSLFLWFCFCFEWAFRNKYSKSMNA